MVVLSPYYGSIYAQINWSPSAGTTSMLNGIYDTSNTLARYDETEMFQIWFVAMVAIAKAYIKCIRPSIGRVGGVGLWLTHIATGVSV